MAAALLEESSIFVEEQSASLLDLMSIMTFREIKQEHYKECELDSTVIASVQSVSVGSARVKFNITS